MKRSGLNGVMAKSIGILWKRLCLVRGRELSDRMMRAFWDLGACLTGSAMPVVGGMSRGVRDVR